MYIYIYYMYVYQLRYGVPFRITNVALEIHGIFRSELGRILPKYFWWFFCGCVYYQMLMTDGDSMDIDGPRIDDLPIKDWLVVGFQPLWNNMSSSIGMMTF